jgi:hypothetical protein
MGEKAHGVAKSGLYKAPEELESDYTLHSPWLASVLSRLASGKLSTSEFPAAAGSEQSLAGGLLVVFFVGGVTYEETKTLVRLLPPRQVASG